MGEDYKIYGIWITNQNRWVDDPNGRIVEYLTKEAAEAWIDEYSFDELEFEARQIGTLESV